MVSAIDMLSTLSKHDIGGIIVLILGVVAIVFGLVRAAVRTALLLGGVIAVLIGILLFTRAI